MTSQQIRQSFLDFFASKQHRIIPSAPVIPHGDPTLLFTNAGMNQFKEIFLGIRKSDYTRVADTQKCIRVSGKHNDLEEVGRDTYHHTFFEMLGNWSFGDYYKKEAIAWAWELLTGVWKLPKERLWATVFTTDDEAFELWKKVTDINPSHILRFGEKDNFWEMGETGPCGPCSEIHMDLTADGSATASLVNAGSPKVIEIWNLVFIQNNRTANGELENLPMKHVDTGMGFERVCAVMEAMKSNFKLIHRLITIRMFSLRLSRKFPKYPESRTATTTKPISRCALLQTIFARSLSQSPTALFHPTKDADMSYEEFSGARHVSDVISACMNHLCSS
jgi:alanyl-tRNA synthetase